MSHLYRITMVEFLKPELEVRSKSYLNLGCGTDIREGWINADIAPLEGVDFIIDIENENLPLDDEVIDFVLLSHLLEHISNLKHVINEVFRVVKKGGRIYIIVPAFSSNGAFQDPTHVRFFTEETFQYISGDVFDYYFGSGKRAEIVSLRKKRTDYYRQLFRFLSPFIRLIGVRRFDNYVDHLLMNMIQEYHVVLQKL